MSNIVKTLASFFKEQCRLAGEVGKVWRNMNFHKFALANIRKIANDDERLASYDSLAEFDAKIHGDPEIQRG